MNNIKLTDSDITAILQCIKVMPFYVPLDVELEANSLRKLSASASLKLIAGMQLDNRESLFVALTVNNAYKALRNEICASQNTITSLSPYTFTINKLQPLLVPLLNRIP